jgi:hypothetical protein
MRIALALLLVGCVAPTSDSDTDIDGDSSTPAPAASGAYQVRSDIDLTVEAVLPQTAANVVGTLRDFATNPAKALFDLAEQAGVSAVGEIRSALPGYIEDKLEGWINGEINKLTVGGVPVPLVAGNIASLAETALTQLAIDSELAIDGTTATHTLKTLDLTPAGFDVRVEIGSLPGDVVTATTTCASAKGALSIGDHAYALHYGEYMWTAINQAVTARYGSDVRGVIGAAVNCPALAKTIASKCYLGYCVGHEAQLTAICEKGVDEIAQRMHDKLADMRFDALHFAAGAAMLVDADRDGRAEALAAGLWTAEINAGMGLRHVPATFSATR